MHFTCAVFALWTFCVGFCMGGIIGLWRGVNFRQGGYQPRSK